MTRRRVPDEGTEVTLPITPMLDMSFQLLFFFMTTFNPTDPEGAQVLAMAREKVSQKESDKMAKDQKKVDDNVRPDNKKKEEKADEAVEIENDLRLFIDDSGGKQPIVVSEGATEIRKADRLDDPELLKLLQDKFKEQSGKVDEKAREQLRKTDRPMSEFPKAREAEIAKLKVRIQTTKDVAWHRVFDAMNLCTHAGFKTVALATPKDYVPNAKAD